MADLPASSERSPDFAPDWLHRALSAARLGTWQWDVASGRVTWSPEVLSIFGITEFEGTYEAWARVVHPADLDFIKVALERALSDRERSDFQVEHRALSPSGKVVWVEARAAVQRREDGTVERLLGIVQDVTSRKELEHQLAQSQRLETVGRLAGGVAHDFNNLLTAIFGAISLAKSQSPPAAQADLQTALDAAERATALTQRLLVFSRQRASDVRLLDLNDVVENSQKMLSRVLREDIRLRVALAPQKLAVRADLAQLEQVLVNLVINAAEAMPGGGVVEVSTRSEAVAPGHERLAAGRYFVLSVRDTGVGMAAEQRQHLFEPFFTTKPHGVGLGLATSLGIVERLGGTCSIESELGAGTTINVLLPEAKPERKLTPAPSPAAQPAGKILIIEDDRAVRETTVRLLVRAGFKVAAAEDEAGALVALAGPDRIDLVVTDVIMPELSGPDLIRRLRERRPDLTALYVSGYAGEALLEHGLSQEDAFLQKPYMPNVLIGRIRELLARR
ncbi:MAG: PAS domain-containing hybrid sensor histidine kinase/response regulator [Myxococcales bacterium]|nr:MAG: PAS domain-containing hybrid sensor histidine kinase/response regulator [Myxococcales bacterium]